MISRSTGNANNVLPKRHKAHREMMLSSTFASRGSGCEFDSQTPGVQVIVKFEAPEEPGKEADQIRILDICAAKFGWLSPRTEYGTSSNESCRGGRAHRTAWTEGR